MLWRSLRFTMMQTRRGKSKATSLNFDNHKTAFGDPIEVGAKSRWEVSRALLVLHVCGYETFVDNSTQILSQAKRCLGEGVVNMVIRKTFYDQFVGGQTPEQLLNVIHRLNMSNVRHMIVCTMEEDVGHSSGLEEIYERNLDRILSCLETISSAKAAEAPLMQLKMTSLISADVLMRLAGRLSEHAVTRKDIVMQLSEHDHQVMEGSTLFKVLDQDQEQIFKALTRLRTIGQKAVEKGIRLLVDAEFSYVKAGISLLALIMMNELNRQQANVWNTYQCYLKGSLEELTEDYLTCRSLGLCFGVKLVRGAYMFSEEQRAMANNYPNPIWESYEQTNQCYNRALEYLLSEVKISGECHLVAATHNEESIYYATRKIEELGLEKSRDQVTFAQLYGMGDQITYGLASCGYNVYKSVPYGPVEEALPYLARRATENKAIFAGAQKEKLLLLRAFRDRFI